MPSSTPRRPSRIWSRIVSRLAGISSPRPRFSTSDPICVTGGGSLQDGFDSPRMAIQSCREAINILNKQELSLQSQVHIAETEARALLRLGDRSGAETSLKKREIVLREIDRLHKTRMSLLSQILLVETAATRQVAVEALAGGVAAHRKLSQRIFEDTQLEKLQDALVEQASFETEISELLGQGFEAITNFDDDTVINLRKNLSDLEHDEVANALAEASFHGVCSGPTTTETLQLSEMAGTVHFNVNQPALSLHIPTVEVALNRTAPPVRTHVISERIRESEEPLTLSLNQTNELFSPPEHRTDHYQTSLSSQSPLTSAQQPRSMPSTMRGPLLADLSTGKELEREGLANDGVITPTGGDSGHSVVLLRTTDTQASATHEKD